MNTTRKTVSAVAAALSLSLAGGAQALVWDNGGPAAAVPGASVMTDTLQAEDFVLSALSDITAITFWNLQLVTGDYLGSIYYQINSGAPNGALVATGTATPTRTAAGSVLGYNQFKNDIILSVAGLAAGTYWLTLHDGPVTSTGFADFYWTWADLNATNTPTTRGLELGLAPPSLVWTTNEQEHAFTITSEVSAIPEPSVGAMAAWGFGVVLLALRRRRAA